jgi:hypothetical protein
MTRPELPPGYVTRARAEHLTKELLDGIRATFRQIPDRVAARWASAQNAEERLAIVDEEMARTDLEIEALRHSFLSQANASDH